MGTGVCSSGSTFSKGRGDSRAGRGEGGVLTYDAGTGVVKHLRRFRGVFALDTSAPTSSGAPAFPLDTYTLAFSVGLAPTLAKQVGAAVALLSPGTVAFAAASSRPPPLPLPGTQVGGGYTVLEARNVSAMAATTGGGASQRQRVLAEVEVWRGVGGACLVLSGHAVALASGLLGFLLSPTHFQTRTRRSLLSPTIGFRFLVAAGAVPLALCHLRQAHTLLAAGREGGRGVPATLADYVGTLTLGFVLMNLVVASVCAGLLYHLVTPDAATRRAQDFNRRIIVLVSIYTHTHTHVYIYICIGAYRTSIGASLCSCPSSTASRSPQALSPTWEWRNTSSCPARSTCTSPPPPPVVVVACEAARADARLESSSHRWCSCACHWRVRRQW